jgi:hypothetical protein
MRRLIATGAAVLSLTGVLGGTAVAATQATGGSVQVKLTSPRPYTGVERAANITCATAGSGYVVKFGRTGSGGGVLTGALTIPSYSGPGAYTGRLTIGATGPRGTAGATLKAVHVTITDGGGSATFSRSATGLRLPRLAGKTVAGSIGWTCAA